MDIDIILIYYVLPNVLLFGGIFYLCKAVEILVQFTIDYPPYMEDHDWEILKKVKQ